MAQDKSKPRFIRKGGKVIPIGGKKKKASAGAKAKVKAKSPKVKPKFQRDVARVKKFEFAGALGGLALGVKEGLRGGKTLIGGALGGAIGTAAGGFAGREIGISAGSVVKKRKGDSKKKLKKRAVNRADRIRKAFKSQRF